MDLFTEFRVNYKLSDIIEKGYPEFSVWVEKINEVLKEMIGAKDVDFIVNVSSHFNEDQQIIIDEGI